MSEGNGTVAKLAFLEKDQTASWEEHRRHGDQITELGKAQVETTTELRETRSDVTTLGLRMDRQTRAFWAAAGTFATLALVGLGVIATLLGGHGG